MEQYLSFLGSDGGASAGLFDANAGQGAGAAAPSTGSPTVAQGALANQQGGAGFSSVLKGLMGGGGGGGGPSYQTSTSVPGSPNPLTPAVTPASMAQSATESY